LPAETARWVGGFGDQSVRGSGVIQPVAVDGGIFNYVPSLGMASAYLSSLIWFLYFYHYSAIKINKLPILQT
jgi:hypothetical protein